MREQLIKAMQCKQLVDMVYAAKDGFLTKRRVKVNKIVGDPFQACCFAKCAKCTFLITNVLSFLLLVKCVKSYEL